MGCDHSDALPTRLRARTLNAYDLPGSNGPDWKLSVLIHIQAVSRSTSYSCHAESSVPICVAFSTYKNVLFGGRASNRMEGTFCSVTPAGNTADMAPAVP